MSATDAGRADRDYRGRSHDLFERASRHTRSSAQQLSRARVQVQASNHLIAQAHEYAAVLATRLGRLEDAQAHEWAAARYRR